MGKKIDRQREKRRNIKENQGFAAGGGSTSKIEICEKCCPRLDIGRRLLPAERHQAAAGQLRRCAGKSDRSNCFDLIISILSGSNEIYLLDTQENESSDVRYQNHLLLLRW